VVVPVRVVPLVLRFVAPFATILVPEALSVASSSGSDGAFLWNGWLDSLRRKAWLRPSGLDRQSESERRDEAFDADWIESWFTVKVWHRQAIAALIGIARLQSQEVGVRERRDRVGKGVRPTSQSYWIAFDKSAGCRIVVPEVVVALRVSYLLCW